MAGGAPGIAALAGALLGLLPATGLAAPGEQPGEALPLAIYRDAGSPANHGAWSITPADAVARTRLAFDHRDRPADGETALRLEFTLPPLAWTAVIVTSAPGYWGTTPGPALALGHARRLAFRARGALGGERIRVRAGVAGDQPFGDSALLPIDSGWLELSNAWRRYTLPIEDVRFTRVVTPFVVIVNHAHNPTGQVTLFLDEIVYE